tara:strand:+ start:724 stop:1299 length:576 start_codon:yes stop_codon:yes gene_type:complete
MLRYLFATIPLILILFIFIGYSEFKKEISADYHRVKETKKDNTFDGIAVLTGGKGRINKGLKLLEKYPYAKLIISGVEENVNIEDLTDNVSIYEKIYLDKMSRTTINNAEEIVNWAKELNLSNILIITSYYHMPRSIMLLKYFEKKLNFVTLPVFTNYNKNGNIFDKIKLNKFLFEEYIKYLLSYIILFFY